MLKTFGPAAIAAVLLIASPALAQAPAPAAGAPAAAPAARVPLSAPAREDFTAVCEFERPGGRSYLLYAPVAAAVPEAFYRCRKAAG